MRTLQLLLLTSAVQGCLAQATGVNFTLQYAHALVEGDKGIVPSATFGLGLQHDFERRVGMGVDLNYVAREGDEVQAFEVIYSAKYFTSNNDATAFYIGSFLGVQKISGTGYFDMGKSSMSADVSRWQFPIGIRAGVRGGLEGYFAEIFTHVGYAIGSGELVSSGTSTVNSKALYFGLGVSFLGFGWE